MDPTTGPGRPSGAPERSTSELVKRVSEQVSTLIVGVALLAVAGVAALSGKNRLSKATPPVPQGAVHGLEADVDKIKERTHR